MESRKIQLFVGLFMLIGMAAGAMLIFKVSNITQLNAAESYTLVANFENIGGLRERGAVKVGGVIVGRVEKIKLDLTRMTPEVHMAIFSEYDQFPSETSASILTSGLLGEQYIGLVPGGDDLILQNGDYIEDTQSALVLEQLIGQFLFNSSNRP